MQIKKTVTTDDGQILHLYKHDDPNWNESRLKFCCPPTSARSVLSLAWIAMKPGVYSPYGKATIEEVASYLESVGIHSKVALWAAQKAEKHYDKQSFEQFTKQFEEE